MGNSFAHADESVCVRRRTGRGGARRSVMTHGNNSPQLNRYWNQHLGDPKNVPVTSSRLQNTLLRLPRSIAKIVFMAKCSLNKVTSLDLCRPCGEHAETTITHRLRASGFHSFFIPLLVLLSFQAAGCKKSSPLEPEELDHRISVRFCVWLMADPNASERQKRVAKEVLLNRENSTIEEEPVLISAHLVVSAGKHKDFLGLGVSDEDGDLVGVSIREQRPRSDMAPLVVEEEYPLFVGMPSKAANTYAFPVRIRQGNERKDESSWQTYIEHGGGSLEDMPPVWISVPESGGIDVEVCLYDAAGHKTEWIPLRVLRRR
jgi:hypothetical protein